MAYGMEEYLKMKAETTSWHKNVCPCCGGACPVKELKEDTQELCAGCEIKHYQPVHKLMERLCITSTGKAYLQMTQA